VPQSIARGYYEGSLVVGYAKLRFRNDAGAMSLTSCFRICYPGERGMGGRFAARKRARL